MALPLSSGIQTKTVIVPTLRDVMAGLKQDIFSSLHCVKIGQIKAFDATQKTATVQILFKRLLPDGTVASYQPLLDCPVVTLQGGQGALQMPIAAGDHCLVLFSDRRLDEWFVNGSEALPAEPRSHDLSDGIALVGINALNSALAAAPSDQVRLSFGATEIGLKSAELDLIGAKVKVSNGATTLLTLLNSLIAAIEAIQVTGNLPLTSSSVTALEAVKTQLAGLLL